MGLLRFLLAISVVIAHSSSVFGLNLVGGQIAVQAFYMISGFYMTLVLNEKYIGTNNRYKLFITNRLLRLYPIYWTVLIMTVLLSIIVYKFGSSGSFFGKLQPYYENIQSMNISAIFFLILTNCIVVFQDLVMFLGLDISTGKLFFTSNFQQTNPQLWSFLLVPQAWTIGIEITYYLIAPFIVRRKVKYIFLLIILSLILRIVLYYNGFQNDPWTYRFFPTELLFFLLGTISYHIYKKIKARKIKKLYHKIIYGLILLITLSYTLFTIPYGIYIYLLLFFLSLPFIFILSKNWKIDRYIGELSYPIYISHMLILTLVKYSHIKISELGVTIVLFSIIFSIFLNEFIAKKVEVYRQNRLNKNI